MAGTDAQAHRPRQRPTLSRHQTIGSVIPAAWDLVRNTLHPHCFACEPSRRHGLKMKFSNCEDGWIESQLTVGHEWEGYCGICHGGIVATILDSAMTNCLFAHGVIAVTAAIDVRYRKPVPAGESLCVRARVIEDKGRLYHVESVLQKDGTALARATAKFIPLRYIAERHKGKAM